MKLGTQTGNLISHIQTSCAQQTPVVGGGATVCLWTDRHACTVTKVEGDILEMQRDTAEAATPYMQDYTYTRNPNGSTYRFKFKDGKWRSMYMDFNRKWKLSKKGSGCGVVIGERDAYYDHSF